MIKTTVVGSYPVPAWLQVMSSRDNLRDAIMAVLKTQELAGIDVVSDGELYRWDVNHAETNGMIEYFIRPLDGVATRMSAEQRQTWQRASGTAFRGTPPGVVVAPLGPGTLDLAADYARFRDLTPLPKKLTVTSPYMLAKTVADQHYGDLGALVMALADVLHDQLAGVDAEVVQVDEANVTGNPQDAAVAAAGINRVLEGARGERAVHLCYGNYGGQRIQSGDYARLLDFLNALQADHVVLELARRPPDELALLRDVKPELALGIGVIDIKDNQVESADEVARRIEHAAAAVGAERIAYVHPDCGFWMLSRSVSDAKMRALVAGRDRFAGTRSLPAVEATDD